MRDNEFKDRPNARLAHSQGTARSRTDKLVAGQTLGAAGPGRRLSKAECK
jgi:hypothetical protein